VKLVYGGFRGIVGPKDLKPEQVAYWEDVLRKATQVPEWKSNLEKNYWSDEFLTGKEFRKDLDETYDAMKSVLVDLGLAK
jgi:putative tricarboxylic transport membrane protein